MRPTAEVKLKTPVADGAKMLDTVTITKPRVRELRLAGEAAKDKGAVEEARQLLSQCSGVLPSVLDTFELDDFTECTNALQALMGEA